MVLYVAFIAILNLALGYGLAVYFGAGQLRIGSRSRVYEQTAYSDDYEEEEYESDDSYEEAAAEDEYESAVS